MCGRALGAGGGAQDSRGLRPEGGAWGAEGECWGPHLCSFTSFPIQSSACTLVTRPQFSLPLGVAFLEKPTSVTPVPGEEIPSDGGQGAPNPPPAALGGPGPDRDLGG
jgi:hypothetical protein